MQNWWGYVVQTQQAVDIQRELVQALYERPAFLEEHSIRQVFLLQRRCDLSLSNPSMIKNARIGKLVRD